MKGESEDFSWGKAALCQQEIRDEKALFRKDP
jgi:hypothetical protein